MMSSLAYWAQPSSWYSVKRRLEKPTEAWPVSISTYYSFSATGTPSRRA